ncbi:MAG TPA: hypothetical protein VNK50_10800 [Calidithermus sp.]|nr:hypothetical protein [Calidithermus sp.]
MRRLMLGLASAPWLLLAGCASEPERQWMKVGQPYTTAEFRRDVAACTRDGRLDEACMRQRGWVDVTPKVEKPPSPRSTDGYRPR